MITGAQAIVDCLRREGIDHVFGIPGTMNLPILDVLRATPEIRFILTRHEQGAAFMAYGFARAVNRPTVVTATEGPGVTNLATGIGAAFKGYVPIISISGAQELWVREKDASQDIDQVTLHRSITKWAYSIPSVSKVQEAVRRAFRVALAEPLGPVHLDVSKDILLEKTEAEPIAPQAYRPSSLPSCSSTALDRAAGLIEQAKKPVLLAGGGVLREDALAALQRLAESSGIPVATLQYHPDAFPTSHRLALGPLGRNGWSSANKTMPQADVVIAVVRDHQPRGEADPSQPGRDRHRRGVPRSAGGGRIDAQLRRRPFRTSQKEMELDRCRRRAQGLGCRARAIA